METINIPQGLEKSVESQNPQLSNQPVEKTVKKAAGPKRKNAWRPDIGSTFGRLTVVSLVDEKGHKIYAECNCLCGGTTKVVAYALLVGNTRSCGCLKKELLSARVSTHHLSDTVEYNAWLSIKARCYNPKYHAYHRYGGRGITMCDSWRSSFETFFADMGARPSSKHSLDRIDNNLPYSAENCRWSSLDQQARNRSNNRVLTLNGESHCVVEWAEKLGIKAVKIYERLRRGISVERALSVNRLFKHDIIH